MRICLLLRVATVAPINPNQSTSTRSNGSIQTKPESKKLRNKISQGIKNVNGQEGVLILTDMFGGTPSNLSYSFLEEGRIEVLSGVNLPILIQAASMREKNKTC